MRGLIPVKSPPNSVVQSQILPGYQPDLTSVVSSMARDDELSGLLMGVHKIKTFLSMYKYEAKDMYQRKVADSHNRPTLKGVTIV